MAKSEMYEYTSTYKLYRELVSLKRAHWTFVCAAVASVVTVVTLACYGAAVVNEQMHDISQSVAARAHSQRLLERRIVEALSASHDSEWFYPLVTRRQDAMIKVNVFASAANNSTEIQCPASAEYENYLKSISNSTRARPSLGNNVFLFAGGHGLGKSYAVVQLGKALSRFGSAIALSMPMNGDGDNFEMVGSVIAGIEAAVAAPRFIIWTFDELDSYLGGLRAGDMRDKSITQFAEYAGFVDGTGQRILAFTMNNAEILAHDYWADRALIENDIGSYAFAEDYRKALQYTGLTSKFFLQEGQLSRLRSFVGNKLFVYKKFDADAARRFARSYLAGKRVTWSERVETKLFGGNRTLDSLYTMRTLKIKMDDIINNSDN